VAVLALSACASDAALRKELADVREQVRALREAQARTEQRVARVEQEAVVGRARGTSPAPTAVGSASPARDAVPELTVIKLRPKKEPAPPLSTAVAVIEPDHGEVITLLDDAAEPAAVVEREAEEADPGLLEIEFEASVSALRTGNVAGGVERLRRFAAENPRHARADNALYFAGLGLAGLQDFNAAAEVLESLVTHYPAGDAVTDALLRLAECRIKLDQVSDARAIYNRLVTAFPGTAAASQAEQRLAALSRTP
jgi:TolA-binding protein